MKRPFSTSSFATGLILGIVLASAWFLGNQNASTPPSSSASVATSTVPALSGSNAISVSNQAAGATVFVESVTVPPPGVWIAVREMNGNNLGNVLGAVRAGGPRSNISVPLLRATEPGRTYAVELYRADSTDTFDLNTLSVYIDFDTGEPVIAYFTTTQ